MDFRGCLLPSGLSFVALLVYFPRVCPTIAVLGDSATFTGAAVSFGVPQPSGYPLFVLLGRLATALPFGDVAWRVNLTSAIFHAAAVGVLADAVRRLTASNVAAVGAATSLAFSRLFFIGSLYAEAFPLNDLLTIVTLSAGLAVYRATAELTWRRLIVFVVVAGIASVHHQMIALGVPSLALLVGPGAVLSLRGRPVRALSLVLGFMLLVGLGYSVVFLAAAGDPRVSWGDVHDLGDLARVFTRRDYGGPFSAALGVSDGAPGDRVLLFARSTWRSLGPLAVVLALVGVVAAWRRSPRLATALSLGPLVSGPVFALVNAIPMGTPSSDAFMERFFTMAHVTIGILVGVGIAALETRARAARWPMALVRPVLSGVGVLPFFLHSGEANLHDDRIGAALIHDLVSPLEPNALLLVAGDALVSAAAYACAGDGGCGDRAIFSPGQLHMPWRRRQLSRWYPGVVPELATPSVAVDLIATNLGARPVYIAPSLLALIPSLRNLFEYSPRGLWLRVLPGHDVATDIAAISADALAMLSPSGSCVGCSVGRLASAAHALDRPLIDFYVTGLLNHARLLQALVGKTDEGRALEARASELEALTAP